MFGLFKGRKKYQFLSPISKERRSILDEDIFLDEEDRQTQNNHKMVNYIRKPFARQSSMVLILTLVALGLTYACLHSNMQSMGNPGLYVTAMAISSMLFSFAGLIYGVLCFMEKEVRKIIAIFGFALCAINFVTWLMVIIIGLRG